MLPELWGPEAWRFLHCVTLDYPENPTNIEQQNVINFFKSVSTVLPCPECSDDFQKVITTDYPIQNYTKTKKDLVHWLVAVHNKVNERLGKKSGNIHDLIKDINNKVSCRPQASTPWIISTVILSMTIIALVIFIIVYNKKRHVYFRWMPKL